MLESITLDFIGTIVAALMTIMILSYLVGDNPLFRVATHIFIGVAAGYAGVIAWDSVIRPNLVSPVVAGGLSGLLDYRVLVPLILVILLLFKLWPITTKVGSIPMAILVGVGAAVVLGGAITGTLIPQTRAAMLSLSMSDMPADLGASPIEHLVNVLIMLLGTISTLFYFHFSVPKREDVPQTVSRIITILKASGRVFIAITFGAMYAGALMAAIIALAERFQFLGDVITDLLGIF
jgi:hypothetical protein